MAEKKNYYEKAKKEMRLSERIVAALPGFRGYKEKELRRESDRLLRDHLYQKLLNARNSLKEIFQKLSDRRMFEVLTSMDRLVAKFDRVSEKVNHASYGYSGFFDTVKIEEDDLDRMIDFDNQLVDEVEKIVVAVKLFKTEISEKNYEKSKDLTEGLVETLDAFEEAFDKRDEVIRGVS